MRNTTLLSLLFAVSCGGSAGNDDLRSTDSYESIHTLLTRCEAGEAMDPDSVGEEVVARLYDRVDKVYSDVIAEEDPCDALIAHLYEDDNGMIGARDLRIGDTIANEEECGTRCTVKRAPDVRPGADSVRIFVVGDMGLDGVVGHQDEVAAGVRKVCFDDAAPDEQCDLGLLLGDNKYDAGIKEDEDTAELEAMLARYTPSDSDVPIYLVLGNHDWRKVFPSRTRARRQLAWIGESENVRGNAHYYTFEAGPVALWGLDTNYMVRRTDAVSTLENHPFTESMSTSRATWKIAFGHHPYLSNGHHGNAGAYRDFFEDEGFRGRIFERYMEQYVMPEMDLYMSGHEHSLQFFPNFERFGQRAGASIVTGSGAKKTGTTALASRCNSGGVAADFEYYDYGFTVLTANPSTLTVAFYDESGNEIWSTTNHKPETDSAPLNVAIAQAEVITRNAEQSNGKAETPIQDAAETLDEPMDSRNPVLNPDGPQIEPLGVRSDDWRHASAWTGPKCGDPELVDSEH